jgi:hypothetical protein
MIHKNPLLAEAERLIRRDRIAKQLMLQLDTQDAIQTLLASGFVPAPYDDKVLLDAFTDANICYPY